MANKQIKEMKEITSLGDSDWILTQRSSDGQTSKITRINSVKNGDGWEYTDDTWAYASASTFTVSGDQTARYSKGTRLKWTQTTVKYGVVVNSSYSSPNTTVTIAVNTNYTIANAAITANFYSYEANPQGYPGTFTYVPTVSCTGSMTIGSLILASYAYSMIGKTVSLYLGLEGTTGGTASYGIEVTLPITSSAYECGSGCPVKDGAAYMAGYYEKINTTTIRFRTTTGANFGLGANRGFLLSTSYDAA